MTTMDPGVDYHTFVDDHLLKSPLAGRSFHYVLINSVGGDVAVHHHWLGLTNSMATILCLQVRLRILQHGK